MEVETRGVRQKYRLRWYVIFALKYSGLYHRFDLAALLPPSLGWCRWPHSDSQRPSPLE